MDRIDIQIEVPALPKEDLLRPGPGEPSAVIRSRRLLPGSVSWTVKMYPTRS